MSNEVLVRMEAAGLGRSGEHIRSRKHSLDEINEGYQDLMNGKNISGVIVHRH